MLSNRMRNVSRFATLLENVLLRLISNGLCDWRSFQLQNFEENTNKRVEDSVGKTICMPGDNIQSTLNKRYKDAVYEKLK